MRFKDWLLSEIGDGGATTSWMHGGIQDIPGSGLNTNLPVQSKISTKDGSDKLAKDDDKVDPGKLFGFKSRADRNRTKERESGWIDKNKRRIPMTVIPSDIMY